MARSKRKSSNDNNSKKCKSAKTVCTSNDDTQLPPSQAFTVVGNDSDTPTFQSTLFSMGIHINKSNEDIELRNEQTDTHELLNAYFCDEKTTKEVIDKFSQSFNAFLEDAKCFQMCLLPCVVFDDDDGNCKVSGLSASLIRLLLEIETLQPLIINTILEKLVDSECATHSTDINTPKLVMNQLRWLGVLYDGQALLSKLMEICTVSSDVIQREIVAALPEIIEDSQHENVVKWLCDLLNENTDISITVLDTLSSLTLDEVQLLKVRSVVINMLPSVHLDKLPVVIKFLLHTLTTKDSIEVIEDIREYLDVSTFALPASEESNKLTNKENADRCHLMLILRAIATCIKFKKYIADVWMKSIDSAQTSDQIASLDIIVLFVIYHTDHKKYAHGVEGLFRSKIRNGIFTKKLLQTTLTDHVQILREYFRSILSFSESLMKSVEASISSFNSDLLSLLFKSAKNTGKQELIATIVSHIGCGTSNEIDCGLNILKLLIDDSVEEVIPFSVFIKGTLDYLQQFTMSQFRRLISILIRLSFNQFKPDKCLQDDMQMLIRKQMASSDFKYVQMGIISAIGIVECLSLEALDLSLDSEKKRKDEIFEQVISLLKLVQMKCKKSADISSLLNDELSNVIQRSHLSKDIMGWVSENVLKEFQDSFNINKELLSSEINDIQPALIFGLDNDEDDATIAVNILPLVSDLYDQHPSDSKRSGITPMALVLHFRILQLIEFQQNDGSLDGIYALLDCPILLTSPEKMTTNLSELSNKQRCILCNCLIIALNWYREIINAFSSQHLPEVYYKVVYRIGNICQLERILNGLLVVTPNFTPLGEPVETSIASKRDTSTCSKQAGRSKNSKKVDDENEDKSKPSQSNNILSRHNPLKDYSKYFRELDMAVFNLLEGELIIKEVQESSELSSSDNLEINCSELHFLLSDLGAKVSAKLITSSVKKFFGKPKQTSANNSSHIDALSANKVAVTLIKLLPYLCEHLTSISVYYQELIDKNDGVRDGPGYDSEVSCLLERCLYLIFQILNNLFSWIGFQDNDNRYMLRDALTVLGNCCRDSEVVMSQSQFLSNTQRKLNTGQRQTFIFIESLAEIVPSFDCAIVLCKLLTSINKNTSDRLNKRISNICCEFMKREWSNTNPATFRENVELLLRLRIQNCDKNSKAMKTFHDLIVEAIQELMDSNQSTQYPTLTKSTLPIYYRVILRELVVAIKVIKIPRSTDSDEIRIDKLKEWNYAVMTFSAMIKVIQWFEVRSNIISLLRYGRQFIEVAIRLCMPLLEEMFRFHHEEVENMIKNFQLCTRTLQHLCGQSKIKKDIVLTNQVPLMKKVLEVFVYRVKAMLTSVNCVEAFWLGNLKNRNIKGVEIHSQDKDEEQKTKKKKNRKRKKSDNSDDASYQENDNNISIHSQKGDDEEEEEEDQSSDNDSQDTRKSSNQNDNNNNEDEEEEDGENITNGEISDLPEEPMQETYDSNEDDEDDSGNLSEVF